MPNVLVHMEIVEDWALRNENSTCSGPRTVKPLSMATMAKRYASGALDPQVGAARVAAE